MFLQDVANLLGKIFPSSIIIYILSQCGQVGDLSFVTPFFSCIVGSSCVALGLTIVGTMQGDPPSKT